MATNSIAISKDVEATSVWQGAVVVLGRFFFALIFLMAGANHFNKQSIGYAASQGVPLASIAVPLCRKARTHLTWLPEQLPVQWLPEAYELARLGPPSANGSPVRFVFLTTPGGKARLQPALAPGNVDKTMAAPVTVIIAWDTEF